MSRKQIYALIGMAILLIVILVGVVVAINVNRELTRSQDEFRTTLDAIKQESGATMTTYFSR